MSAVVEKILTGLDKRLKVIETMLSQSAEVMDANSAACFLKMSKSSFDKITRPKNMLIPVVKMGGKKKVFMRKDLMDFIEKCKQESIAL